ncbi:MAG: hypothetical protein ACJ77K_12480 [Bacteroidia bacterium]
MKKFILPFAVFALIFASCEKQTPQPVNTEKSVSINDQMNALIQKADPDLYARLHGRGPKPDVKITHGTFHIPPIGGPESGYCIPPYSSICHITITWPALIGSLVPDTTYLTTDFSRSFAKSGDGELILNASPDPIVVNNLKSVDIVFDRDTVENSSIEWSSFKE